MDNTVAAIPEGYHTITPYLIVNDAASAIEFYKKAFGAIEVLRMAQPGEKIAHAELKIGDSKFMLADECPESGSRSPQAYGGSAITIHLYVIDVDQIAVQAVAAGATLECPVENKFYGDRNGIVIDPYGHKWCVSTHIEDVSDEDTMKRASKLHTTK